MKTREMLIEETISIINDLRSPHRSSEAPLAAIHNLLQHGDDGLIDHFENLIKMLKAFFFIPENSAKICDHMLSPELLYAMLHNLENFFSEVYHWVIWNELEQYELMHFPNSFTDAQVKARHQRFKELLEIEKIKRKFRLEH